MTDQNRIAKSLANPREGVAPGRCLDTPGWANEKIKAEVCAVYLLVDVSDDSPAREVVIGSQCVGLGRYHVVVGYMM